MYPAQTPINTLAPPTKSALNTLITANLGAVFPALSLFVLHNGKPLLHGAWGWIDPETQQTPVTTESRFDLASVTKLFTTSASLALISAGATNLDAPLIKYIPEFGASGPRPLNGGQNPHTREMLPTPPETAGLQVDPAVITLRHLLTHTSGLAPWRDVFNVPGPPPPPPDQSDPMTRAERWGKALTALCQYPFVDTPGHAIHYSDLGLMLLGEVVARLHGTPGQLAQAIQAHILDPLGLTSIAYRPLDNNCPRDLIPPTEFDDLWRGRRCWGEVHDENACGVGGVAGHAGLFATAHDVAALGQAWLTDDPRLGITPDLLNKARQEQATTGDNPRGLGWMLKSQENASSGDLFSPTSYGHTGFTGTSLWVDPQRQLVVACLTNRVYPGRHKPGIHTFRRALHTLIAQEIDTL